MLRSQIPVKLVGAWTSAPDSCAGAPRCRVVAVGVVVGAGLAGTDGSGADVGAVAVDTAVASSAGQP